MPEDIFPLVDLRTAAMDLARRLSSLKHFLPAAHQLLTCECLAPENVNLHSRKIVTLIEVARSTLKRYHVRLYLFASCNPALAYHREAYFNLLRMLKRLRPSIKDPSLSERISRLLLSLSTSMHISTGSSADRRPAATCSADTRRPPLLSPRSPSSPPLAVSYPAVRYRAPHDGSMLPPDVLLARARERVPSDGPSPQPDPESPPRGRQPQRLERPPDDEIMLHHEGSGELPSYVPKPVRRFGILFTMRKPYQRHHR